MANGFLMSAGSVCPDTSTEATSTVIGAVVTDPSAPSASR
jgi:hypothetical protein